MRSILLSINEESIFQSITADPIFARDAVYAGNPICRLVVVWRKNVYHLFGRKIPQRKGQKCKTKEENGREKLGRCKKGEERNKIVLALEDEQARTAAKNEQLLFLARKYYTKWQTLHRLDPVRNFLNLFRGLNHDFILVRGSLIERDNHLSI